MSLADRGVVVGARRRLASTTDRTGWFFWPILVVAFVWCVALVVGHMRTFPQVSPFDEATHFDYVVSFADFDVPRLGEPFDDDVLREWSCRGAFDDAIVLPPCDQESLDYRDYPNDGIQRNVTGPLYYVGTAALVGPAGLLTDSTMTVARLTGALVLCLTSLLTVFAVRETGVASRGVTWLVVLAFPAAVPAVLHAVSTVNSDGGVMLFGAAVVAAAVAFDARGQTNPWPLLALAFCAGLTKQTAIFPIVFASAMIVLARWTSWQWADVRRAVAFPALLSGLAGGTLLIWEAVVDARALPGYVSPIGKGNTIAPDGAPYDEFFGVAFDMIPPLVPSWNHPALDTVLHVPSMRLLQIVALGAIGWLVAGRREAGRSFGWALVLACVAVPVVVNTVVYRRFGTYFEGGNPRYGLGLFPAMWVGVACFLSSGPTLRRLSLALAALAAITGVASVV